MKGTSLRLGLALFFLGIFLAVLPGTSGAEVLAGNSYTIKKGDTLWHIARRNQTKVAKIIEANKLKNPNLLFPGQKIIIPSPFKLYRVEKGDTFWGIAKKYKLSFAGLVKANPSKNPNHLHPGQVIVLKGSPVPQKPKSPPRLAGKVIIVDPGHGGKDAGAVGPSGLREKDVNLDVALRLAAALRAQGAKVMLTRTDNRFIALDKRVALANGAKASIFISIHCNSSSSRAAKGTETFTSPGSVQGRLLAGYVHNNYRLKIPLSNRGVKTARFYVLRKNRVPAPILIEMAFISNPSEEKLLRSRSLREKAVAGILAGILRYYGK